VLRMRDRRHRREPGRELGRDSARRDTGRLASPRAGWSCDCCCCITAAAAADGGGGNGSSASAGSAYRVAPFGVPWRLEAPPDPLPPALPRRAICLLRALPAPADSDCSCRILCSDTNASADPGRRKPALALPLPLPVVGSGPSPPPPTPTPIPPRDAGPAEDAPECSISSEGSTSSSKERSSGPSLSLLTSLPLEEEEERYAWRLARDAAVFACDVWWCCRCAVRSFVTAASLPTAVAPP